MDTKNRLDQNCERFVRFSFLKDLTVQDKNSNSLTEMFPIILGGLFAQVCFISFCSNFFSYDAVSFKRSVQFLTFFYRSFILEVEKKSFFLWMRPQICIHRAHRILVHTMYCIVILLFILKTLSFYGKGRLGKDILCIYVLQMCIGETENWKIIDNRASKKNDWQKKLELNFNCLIVWDNYIFSFLRLDFFYVSEVWLSLT